MPKISVVIPTFNRAGLLPRAIVAAVEEPVAIYRKAVAESQQMCSNAAEICKHALRVQQMALDRPRACASENAKGRYVRSKFRDRAYEILMTEATNSSHEGKPKSARANILDAFRCRPFRTVASGRLLWLLTPKAFANLSPGFKRSEKPGINPNFRSNPERVSAAQ